MTAPNAASRIVLFDIARIMAACFVMYAHLPLRICSPALAAVKTSVHHIFADSNAVFFVMAGYFVSRNITCKKALYNSWWALAPFVFWNTLTLLLILLSAPSRLPTEYNIFTLFGIQSFVLTDWALFPKLASSDYYAMAWPVNGALWFMRDLVFLFLLSPLLAKSAKYLFPALVLASLYPALSSHFTAYPTQGITLSPYALTLFMGGCFLQSLSKDIQHKFLSFYSPTLIIAYLALMLIDVSYLHTLNYWEPILLCKQLLGTWVLFQICRWIEVRFPRSIPTLLKLAPVTFLTFAAHFIIFGTVQSLYQALGIGANTWGILLPLLTFALMTLFFIVLKRYCPALLHLVAHYKLTPGRH